MLSLPLKLGFPDYSIKMKPIIEKPADEGLGYSCPAAQRSCSPGANVIKTFFVSYLRFFVVS